VPDYGNQSLSRGIKILECLGDAGTPLSATEVARRTGLHRATVHRLLHVLAELGYAHKDAEDASYTTGFYLHTFGRTPNVIASLVRHARPFLERLAKATGQNVCLGALEGIQMIYCDKVSVAQDIGITVQTGLRLDAHATAIGKALLAIRPEAEVRQVYEHHRLSVHTPRTLRSVPSLMRALAEVRRLGYAVERDEYVVGRRSVASAIINPYGRATCAVSLEGPASVLDDVALPRPAPRLGEHTAEVLREVGIVAGDIAGLAGDGIVVDGR
jgi:IclR family acetate operon transcriptional repressor